jgi:hypothetical protein
VIPIEHPNARDVSPWESCIVAQRNAEVMWSGPVNKMSSDLKTGKMNVTAIGWFDKLMRLYLPDQLSFTAADAGSIISSLLSVAVSIDPKLPIRMGSVEVSQPRTITYAADQNIGQAIIDLSQIEDGIDWYVDPVTRKLEIHARIGQDRPSCKWTFLGDGISKASNLDNVVQDTDGDIVNDMRVHGKNATGVQDDGVSKARYGVFQEVTSLSDVVDPTILVAYAGAEILYRSEPRITYTLTPKSSSKASVPVFGRDFDNGDITYLTVRRGFINVVDQAQRIFGVTLSIQDNNTTMLTNLQMTAS